MANEPTVFSGTANPQLAAAIAAALGTQPGRCEVARFPDGEVSVRLGEPVCGKDVILVQPTAPPVNDHLMELLALADACRRAVAGRVVAVVPYYGYARSDKQQGRREPIMARVVADLIEAVDVAHVITMDLHTPQIEGFFRVPAESLSAVETLCEAMRERLPAGTVVVSPDGGRVTLATRYARCLGLDLVVLHKRREDRDVTVTHVVGEVAGRPCLVVDDMISTGGTLAEAIRVLLDKGARPEVFVAATHALLLGNARARLDRAEVRGVFVTDTVRCPIAAWDKLHVVSVAPALGAALQRFLGRER